MSFAITSHVGGEAVERDGCELVHACGAPVGHSRAKGQRSVEQLNTHSPVTPRSHPQPRSRKKTHLKVLRLMMFFLNFTFLDSDK